MVKVAVGEVYGREDGLGFTVGMLVYNICPCILIFIKFSDEQPIMITWFRLKQLHGTLTTRMHATCHWAPFLRHSLIGWVRLLPMKVSAHEAP